MKKMMIATLAAASVLLAVANQAHAGATLDAVQKKVLCNAGSVMDYLGSLMPMQTVSFQVLMLMFVVVLPLLYLVTTRK
ncbi:hypothetical protein ECZC10_00720 [Escherichia coli]|nr:hypothetical protein ECZC10_00720 [Escherichia coli]